jgi:Asp-tRNA(Asn)/Glu-tRNA(Gln) amidotransferase A subunit family amidase
MFENTPLFDCIGPITATVADAAAVFDAIAGPVDVEPLTDRADQESGYDPGDATAAVGSAPDPSSLTLGVLEHGFGANTTDRVADRIRDRLDRLADAGATLTDVDVDHVEHATAVKSTLSLVSNAMYWGGGTHENRDERSRRSLPADFTVRRDARGGRLNTQLKAKIVAGAALLEDDGGSLYRTAMAARDVLIDSFESALSDVDALVTPTMPTVATRIENSPPEFDYGQNVRPASVTGGPAVTLPAGTVEGLPVGLHLAGPRYADADLLGAAAAVASVD